MELRKLPPVRWLSGRESVTYVPPPAGQPASEPAGENGSNGNGHRPGGAFIAAPRHAAPPAFAIDRMVLEDVSVFYGAKPAVKSVSLPIRQGEVLALIGPSGCGKTTLLRSLNRLTELSRGASLHGRITLDGIEAASSSACASPARSRPIRKCCCSTSRAPHWTRCRPR